jgi:hypothetical protein
LADSQSARRGFAGEKLIPHGNSQAVKFQFFSPRGLPPA